MIEGGCACGACRYRIDAADLDDVAIYHCGAHLVLWTPLAPDTLDVTVSTLDHPERHPPDRLSG